MVSRELWYHPIRPVPVIVTVPQQDIGGAGGGDGGDGGAGGAGGVGGGKHRGPQSVQSVPIEQWL